VRYDAPPGSYSRAMRGNTPSLFKFGEDMLVAAACEAQALEACAGISAQ
jgi:hypothetical protein